MLEYVFVAASLAVVLLAKPMHTDYFLTTFEEPLSTRLGVVRATLLTVALAVVLSIVFSFTVGRYLVRTLRVAGRVWALILLSVVTASLFYFALPETRLWNLARVWWSGPHVNLVSGSRVETFRPTVNLPWVSYGQDFGAVAGWSRRGVSQNREGLEASFERMRQGGVKCVLWFLLADGRGAPSFDDGGYPKGLDESFWQDYDAAIEIARKHQIGIIWVLLDFHWFAEPRHEAGATLSGHADVLEDEGKMESFFQRVLLPIVRRHPFEPHIVGWLLINEPENALKDARVSAKRLSEFTRRASSLIKRYAYRQPVSVGSADLESLMEYWCDADDGLDFLVFHHYEKFLPPPAEHVRRLKAGAANKPIYIGEFDLAAPPLPVVELARRSESLGYAGLWAWSLNDQTAVPRYEEAKQLSEAVAGLSPGGANFPGPDADWWERHGSETVLPGVSANIKKWESDFNGLEKQLGGLKAEREAKERELKVPVAECFRLNHAELDESKVNVTRLTAQVEVYKKQIEQAEANKDKAWKDKVLAWMAEAEGHLKKERENVTLYEGKLKSCEEWKSRVEDRIKEIEAEEKSKEPLANWYRYKVYWSRKLYQEFWHGRLGR